MAGGSAGAGGAAGAKSLLFDFTFDQPGDTQGFTLQTFVDPGPAKNLGAKAADAGVPIGYPTLLQVAGAGQGVPASGALEVTANFTDWQQYLEVRVLFSPPLNLSGAIVHAAVKVNAPFLGGAFLYAKSGVSYVYANSIGTALSSGVFTPLAFDLDTAVGVGGTFDPRVIEEVGIHIYSDGAFDGGAPSTGKFTFDIDNVIATN
jgi:hypothetical protein